MQYLMRVPKCNKSRERCWKEYSDFAHELDQVIRAYVNGVSDPGEKDLRYNYVIGAILGLGANGRIPLTAGMINDGRHIIGREN